ncbi:TRAP dicarboxylate transporter, DctM subunit [Caldalkalibacillus thermarum TA2.A1]|uniref:TRAP dicarboxylate transporter, DctM subunit n=1 Tax=Caldalkalibacillus thermarum (strain TA2.A1) TaxID=986075 RepID=F5L9I2_CALTT|nr:TRAP transporter large permease [Caldalkalibacillus thermarum]EGL81969.1 TRAP dicarboxylate transporter, DctM subunit [Caldalkalibacillus thermarum TA2.A1]QZT34464.1 TRAP transporter large permease [Caldalkalibacillus thermarum TA2.A1]
MVTLLFIILLVLFLINVPIAIALGLASVIIFALQGNIPLVTLPQRMFAALDSFPLMAAPFFILAGKLMEHGGISQRIVDFAKSLVGQLKGGLANVSIVSCMIFAALSGSASATTAAVGAILIAAMVKEGYSRPFASAVQAAGGTTGIVIPPSVPMVLYGVSAGVSVSALFIAGILPGLLIGLSLMLTASILSHLRGYGAATTGTSLAQMWRAFKRSFLAMLMPVIILGGIYGGIFTPTEASVVAVVYGFLIGWLVYKQLNLKVLRKILVESVVTSSVILFIIATASLFGMILTREQVPQSVASWFIDSPLSPALILLLINVLLLVVGTFMETIASIIILTPILLPVVTSLGMDPIHFGIIMVVNLSIGLITPPVGVCLFVASQVGKSKYETVVRAVLPFLLMMMINLLVITFIPEISLGLLKFTD